MLTISLRSRLRLKPPPNSFGGGRSAAIGGLILWQVKAITKNRCWQVSFPAGR
jgi:hypothetical protein